jgi:Deoxynucleoside kinases
MRYKFITIEGNIGAGKTTLSQLLQKKLNARLILEQFADNPFLPKFYENRDKYAFPLELSFLAERYKQLKQLLNTADLFCPYTISDYLFIKSKLFAKVNLPEDEFRLYETLFDIIYPKLPEPDLVIFLYSPLDVLRRNIRQRNRSYEQSIPDEYLLQIQDVYLNFLKANPYRTIAIDMSEVDFIQQPHLIDRLLYLADKPYETGWHVIELPD